MAHGETVNRILRAAIVLFAERGFAETSLRTITGMADVNLAAVNYHFGNKKSLIQAVFSHFLTPFCKEIEVRLDKLERMQEAEQKANEQAPAVEIEALLRILLESLAESTQAINERPQRFMRLLSLAYTQSQEHLRQYLVLNYSSTYKRYLKHLDRTLPNLDPITFYWRLNFLLGSAVFTLGSFESIQAILTAEHDVDMELDGTMEYLIPSMAGMLKAPTEL